MADVDALPLGVPSYNDEEGQPPPKRSRSDEAAGPVQYEVAEAGPKCVCGQTAVLKTSNSAKNPGRKFYACPKDRNNQCEKSFRGWVDEWQSGNKGGNGSGGSVSATLVTFPGQPPTPTFRTVVPTTPVEISARARPKTSDDLHQLLTANGYTVKSADAATELTLGWHGRVFKGLHQEVYFRYFLRDGRGITRGADPDYDLAWLPWRLNGNVNWLTEGDADVLVFGAGPVGSKKFAAVGRRPLLQWLKNKLGPEPPMATSLETALYQLWHEQSIDEYWLYIHFSDLARAGSGLDFQLWDASSAVVIPAIAPI